MILVLKQDIVKNSYPESGMVLKLSKIDLISDPPNQLERRSLNRDLYGLIKMRLLNGFQKTHKRGHL